MRPRYREQWGVRHFRIEERLLAPNADLRRKVLELKRQGMKTEPAFAKVFGLPGDPYEAILRLEDLEGLALQTMIRAAECDRMPPQKL